ncbi:MAG: metallophosphoesterase [Acidimicrobiia bacterium]|nr:metallophosphoesterase [Acidimicrobiia bacterium]
MFLADMQIGMYATFSGLDEAGVADYAERDLRVWSVPDTEGIEWDVRRYEEAVAVVNGLRPEAVVIGGDMVDDPNAEDQYEAFMRVTSRIDPDIDVRWLPGNHDIADDTVAPTPDSIERYRAAFGPDRFAFDLGPVRFVALNTPLIDHPEHVPGELAAQEDFLAGELADAVSRGRRVVLVGHHPLFLESADEPDTYWNLPAERRRPVLDLVHRHGVGLMLAGHWHRNRIARDGTFEMVTSGPVGYPLGDDPSGVRVVEVGEQGVRHRYIATGGR